jgi:hypothetical protein
MIKKNMVYDTKDGDFLIEDLDNIKDLLSFNLGLKSDINLKGSASIKSQINYADYDFLTIIKINNKIDFDRFRLNLLNNIDVLVNKYDSIITDIKFGIDQFKYFENKKNYSGKEKIVKIQHFILNNKYYSDEEKKDLELLYKNIDYNDILTIDDYLDYYRKCYTLRWDINEIKKGYITLHKQNKKYFIECFVDPSIFKIDLLSQLRNGINEISNIILFDYKNKIINQPSDVDYKTSIKSDFTYYWNAGSYYKALKRLFIIYKASNKIELGNILTNLFNSSVGLLYKIVSTFKNIEEFNIKLKKENILYEIDKMKSDINNVWGLDNPFFQTITNKLEALKRTPYNTTKMKTLIKDMDNIINSVSLDYINEMKMKDEINKHALSNIEYINNFF